MTTQDKTAAHGAIMVVDGASLHVRRSGYGEQDGSGYFVLDENDVEWRPHDEREGCYLEVRLAKSEMIELRDFLLREYPPTQDPAKEIERLRSALIKIGCYRGKSVLEMGDMAREAINVQQH